MKRSLVLGIGLLMIGTASSFIISKQGTPSTFQDTSILKKIANAHGFKNWAKVSEIQFTFNVDRDTAHYERSWVWETLSNDITAITTDKTLKYNRSHMDSIARKTNGGFINDKYWLLTPFQLVWDANNITYSLSTSKAPISNKNMQKLTLVYGSEGGYTPGDAYDLYFGDDYMIREWVYRKGNRPDPSLTTTFEEYITVHGLKIPTMHKNAAGSFKLYFTDIRVK